MILWKFIYAFWRLLLVDWENYVHFKKKKLVYQFIIYLAELSNRLGRVTCIRVLPSGCAFSAIWGPPDLPSPLHQQAEALPLAAVFTPFGAQTWCSLEGDEDAHGWVSIFFSKYSSLAPLKFRIVMKWKNCKLKKKKQTRYELSKRPGLSSSHSVLLEFSQIIFDISVVTLQSIGAPKAIICG